MIYRIHSRCRINIVSFYQGVAKKYRHTYSEELMLKNIDDAINGIFLIEKTLLRRKPTIGRWQVQGWHMAHAGTWYYAYTIDGDTITIQDACHQQNMHEDDK